jgi:predicted AAA+ superfamily ATPase
MPELYAKDRDWKHFYGDYVKTYIERDVYRLAQIGDEIKFLRFMEVLAARNANVLNLEDVCKDTGVSHPTAERWLSILRVSNIVYLLRPYHNNLTKRAIKSPKLYFLDTGLAAYLTRWDTKDVLRSGFKSGDFLENFIVAEVLKSYFNAGIEPNNLYYYRDKDRNEIDLIIDQNGTLYPVEIKSRSNPDKSDIKAFEILKKIPNAQIGDGAVICQCNDVLAIAEGVRTLPVWYV